MSSANPYAAPQSDVNAEASGAAGSVEDALAGRYDFTIEEVLKDAWRLTNGFKLTFWGAAIVVFVALAIVGGILGAVTGKMGIPGAVLRQVVTQGISFVIMLGVVMLAVRRAGGLPVTIGHAFSYFDRWMPAIIAGVLTGLLTSIGILLLILPGIYLAIAYGMTVPLIGDRKMGPWEAMETSRKAVSNKWFKCFGTALVAGIITLVSGILIIPLIWTVPWLMMVSAVCYRRIFGVASTA
jgi:hypothetical protein